MRSGKDMLRKSLLRSEQEQGDIVNLNKDKVDELKMKLAELFGYSVLINDSQSTRQASPPPPLG